MLQSQLFTKTLREAPKDELAKNAQFLIRGGFIDKLMAGVYSFLPLGLRVIKKIENIIREEMNAIGGEEILMPAIHPLENYQITKRDAIDVLFHTNIVTGQKAVLGQSHEEVVVPLLQKFIDSYKDLPRAVYQIQIKFRNELRPKSGIFRGREFIMKDLYSFHADEKDFEQYYEEAGEAYKKIFSRLDIGQKTYYTYASGGTFSKYSHEFQTLTEVGEDTIYICEKCSIAVNNEIIADIGNACPKCGDSKIALKGEKTIEVANIFPLTTRFSDPFGLVYKNADGEQKPVIMGCYGMGITRLMGVIAELHNDESGIIWPSAVAPFAVHIIEITSKNENIKSSCKVMYEKLTGLGVEVLYDDRDDKTAGEKFADSDLIGIPWRIVVSDKTMKEKKIEVKKRGEKDISLMEFDSFLKLVC